MVAKAKKTNEAETVDTIEAASQVRVHWLAMQRRGAGRQSVEALLAAHIPEAVRLFQGFVGLSDMDFDDRGMVVNPWKTSTLREAYKIVRGSEKITITSSDVLKCRDIVMCAILGGQASNVSVFSQMDFDSSMEDILAALRAAPEEDTTSWSKVGKLDVDVRRFSWFVLVSAGFLPDMSELPDGVTHKVIIANVQGKYKSMVECAKSHSALYADHVKRCDTLRKSINDADFSKICLDMLDSLDVRSIDARRLTTIEHLLGFALDSACSYNDYVRACSAGKWLPQKDLFDFFRAHADVMRRHTQTVDGKTRVARVNVESSPEDEEGSDVSVFELLNEMRWLRTHNAGIKYPNYEGAGYAVKLGNNYFRIGSIEVVRGPAYSTLRVTFTAVGQKHVCDFMLGRWDDEYWNNLKFVPNTGKEAGTFRVSKIVRRHTPAGPKFYTQEGVLKEPEIREEHGVLGVRLPVSWTTKTKRPSEKKSDENKVQTFDGGVKKVVYLTATPFAKPESFQNLVEFRNSAAAGDGYIYFAGFDQGERDQVVGIYRTRKYESSSLPEFFDVADSIERVACYNFSDYQRTKLKFAHSGYVEQNREPLEILEKRIKSLRRLVSTLGSVYRGEEMAAKLLERRRSEWAKLTSGSDVRDFDTEIEAAKNMLAQDIVSAVKNPNYIVNVIDASVYAEFKRQRADRAATYMSQHQNDYLWLRAVDGMLSLRNAIARFTEPPTAKYDRRGLVPGTEKLHAYRDNLMKQFRKEVAAFLRDSCLLHDVRFLAVETLAATAYISDDSDANRKRALFAPAELQKDIKLACDLHDIAVVTVDEVLTSREAPNGSLGFRSNKEGYDWKDLHYVDDAGLNKIVHADENATANIAKRMWTCGASKPRVTRPGLLAKKKGPVLLTQLAYRLHQRQQLPKQCDAQSVAAAGLDMVSADLGTELRNSKGFIYVDRGRFVIQRVRRERMEKIGKDALTTSRALPWL